MTNRATTKFITACRGVVGGVVEIPPDTGPGDKVVVRIVLHGNPPGNINNTRGPTGRKKYTVMQLILFIISWVILINLVNAS